ncbi:MAG: PAS domain S-box protein [Negativicutes bacterium]|nr:PAS domain S-box protein [Negativicutes bacterium]
MEEASIHCRDTDIAEAARDIILVVDLEGKILKANEAASLVYGYTREELIGMSIFNLRTPETAQQVYAQMQQANSEGTTFETWHRRKDGKAIPVEVSSKRALIGNKIVLLSTIRDISSRVNRDAELRKLSAAVEQSPVSVVITDLKGSIEYVNPKFIEVTGYTLTEVIGQNPRILKSGFQPPEMYQELWNTITSGREWRGEFHNKKKNGELFWEMASISPIRTATGEITHFIAVKEDITERKKADEALLQAHAELSQIIESAGDGICVVDLEARIIRANSAFAAMCGAPVEQLVGEKTCELFPCGFCETPNCSFVRMLQGESRFEFDQEVIDAATGKKRHWLVSISRFYDAAGELTGMVKKYKDITERIRMQEAMQRDLQLAGKIQRGFLPCKANLETVIVDTVYEPYHHVSGDVFDYAWDGRRRIFAGYVADMMGHGVGTALQTSALRVLFRQAFEKALSPKSKLAWINRAAMPYFAEDTFAAAIYFELDFARNSLTYSAAGINYFLASADARHGVVSIPGPFLGIADQEDYEEHWFSFRAGDSFYFMSDGLFDLLRSDMQVNSLVFQEACGFLRMMAKSSMRRDDASALCIHIK